MMTISRSTFPLFLISFFLVLSNRLHLALAEDRFYSHFFAFGDSNTDNGNYIHYAETPSHVARPPYGETFFKYPTGRYSDGRVIMDFICMLLLQIYLMYCLIMVCLVVSANNRCFKDFSFKPFFTFIMLLLMHIYIYNTTRANLCILLNFPVFC
jgi:hypothetical protein